MRVYLKNFATNVLTNTMYLDWNLCATCWSWYSHFLRG